MGASSKGWGGRGGSDRQASELSVQVECMCTCKLLFTPSLSSCPHAKILVRFGQERKIKAGEDHKGVGISWLVYDG